MTALIKPVTHAVYRIIFYQLTLIIGFILILSALKGMTSGLSALAGALAYWLPSCVFVRSLAACASARAIARFMITFFAGEAIKLALSGVLFLMAVSYLHAQAVYAVIGLLVAIVAFWVASAMSLYRTGVAV